MAPPVLVFCCPRAAVLPGYTSLSHRPGGLPLAGGTLRRTSHVCPRIPHPPPQPAVPFRSLPLRVVATGGPTVAVRAFSAGRGVSRKLERAKLGPLRAKAASGIQALEGNMSNLWRKRIYCLAEKMGRPVLTIATRAGPPGTRPQAVPDDGVWGEWVFGPAGGAPRLRLHAPAGAENKVRELMDEICRSDQALLHDHPELADAPVSVLLARSLAAGGGGPLPFDAGESWGSLSGGGFSCSYEPPRGEIVSWLRFLPNPPTRETMAGFMVLARVKNFVPSAVLVLVGAGVAGYSFAGPARWGASATVGLVALLTGLITSGSMIINDFHDFKSGVDVVNTPHNFGIFWQPLVTGIVSPDDALLAASTIFVCVLLGACLLEPFSLRLVVAASAVLTFAYTPLLKPLTAVKNVAVAAIIAMALVAGGLAGGTGSLARTALPGAYMFFAILSREVMMDIKDAAGDRLGGVPTLAVKLGTDKAFAVAMASLAVASCVGAGAGLAAFSGARAAAFATSLAVAHVPLYVEALGVRREGYDKHVCKISVDRSMRGIGAGLALVCLAAMALNP